MLGVRSSAYLLGVISDGIYFDYFAVLGAEYAGRSLFARLLDGHFAACDGDIFSDYLVDGVFYRFLFPVGQRALDRKSVV